MMAAGRILMGHGGGGLMTRELVAEIFLEHFGDEALLAGDDAAVLEPARGRPVFTTDAFTVTPLFFPGGDLGCLAVYGTVNDLAVCGAVPACLSLAWILEEGLPLDILSRLAASAAAAAGRAGVRVVAADTKVVERGRGDGVYLSAAGLGYMDEFPVLGLATIEPGDAVIISGPVGDHGAAVLLARSGLEFSPPVASDCQPLAGMLQGLYRLDGLRFMRDPTRGGLAAALKEIAEGSGRDIWLVEEAVPVRPAVRAAAHNAFEAAELLPPAFGIDHRPPLDARSHAQKAADTRHGAQRYLRHRACLLPARPGVSAATAYRTDWICRGNQTWCSRYRACRP